MATSGRGPLSASVHRAGSAYIASLLPQARIEAQFLQQCPEIELFLINADFPRRPLAGEVAERLMQSPPYWAFCWASGQVLARFLLDHPHWVRGRRVLDFGAGSGVVGIAARLAGAAQVTCCDVDATARAMTLDNARRNGVDVGVCSELPDGVRYDLIAVADVLYDRDNLPLLEQLRARADTLLLADSRLKELPAAGFGYIGAFVSSTWPDLDESAEFRRVRLYSAGVPPAV